MMGIQGNINDWRNEMLDILDSFGDDVNKVEWSTAQDEVVCSLCTKRDGKVHTISEVKRELAGEFCKPIDPDDRCRCTFLPVYDD
jgi:hypothetical protein